MSTFETCPFIVTRDYEQESCDKPAVCVIRYEWDGAEWIDPACAYHANGHGRAAGLPITAEIAEAIKVASQQVQEL
ncbi:MAG: hypothetical protein M3Y35_04020 [Actinomycetota bacterium]|nr:hypothetical protein [Actinomycetota bacterium]